MVLCFFYKYKRWRIYENVLKIVIESKSMQDVHKSPEHWYDSLAKKTAAVIAIRVKHSAAAVDDVDRHFT